MQLYCIQLNLTQLQMDMSKLPQDVEDELQAFLELLFPNTIVLRSRMPKESIEISKMFSKVKKET